MSINDEEAKLRAMTIPQIKKALIDGTYGDPNNIHGRLAKFVLGEKIADEDRDNFKRTLETSAENAVSTRNLVKATWVLAIFTALLAWFTVYAQFSNKTNEAHENLKTFLMSLNLNYPVQIVLDSLNDKERLEIAKDLLTNVKDIEFEYETKYKIKFKLKPQDKLVLSNRLADIRISELYFRIFIFLTIIIPFVIIFRKNQKVSKQLK